MTPLAARRLLYAMVAACLLLTAGTAVLRPAPPATSGPQHPVSIPVRPPFLVPEESMPSNVVTVPMSGLSSKAVRTGSAPLPVHGLPGQVGASPS